MNHKWSPNPVTAILSIAKMTSHCLAWDLPDSIPLITRTFSLGYEKCDIFSLLSVRVDL